MNGMVPGVSRKFLEDVEKMQMKSKMQKKRGEALIKAENKIMTGWMDTYPEQHGDAFFRPQHPAAPRPSYGGYRTPLDKR